MKLRFLPQAYRDIERLYGFLSPKNPDAASRVVDLLFDAAKSLKDAPNRGRLLGHTFRELIVPFGKGAYILRYRFAEEEDVVWIVRIWHSRERRE